MQAAHERASLERAWRSFEARITRELLARPLPDYWVPQQNRRVGATYYFNLKTGQISEEHPHMKFVRLNTRVEREKLDAALHQSWTTHQALMERVRSVEVAHRRALEARALAALDQRWRFAK